MSQSPGASLPLFYSRPAALNAGLHGDLKLKGGDFAFAADTNASPLAVVEFASAGRHYPIVFSDADHFPLALLGLERQNRFLDQGQWEANAYVPAYIRRYPFVFIETRENGFALAVDMASERLQAEEGAAFFADGKPSELTEGAMAFCKEFHAAHVMTRAFVTALKAHDLLVPHHVDARLGPDTPLKLSGFSVVDRARFDALADEAVLEWHRNGWLALVHLHLNSLDRFNDLLVRERAAIVPADQAA